MQNSRDAASASWRGGTVSVVCIARWPSSSSAPTVLTVSEMLRVSDSGVLVQRIAAHTPSTLVVDRDRVAARKGLIAHVLRTLKTSIYLRE